MTPILERVGDFYRQPNAPGTDRRIFSLLVLGCGVLLVAAFLIPHFKPPVGGEYFILWLAGLTGVLGALAVVRKERGTIGAAAAVVAFLAVSSVAFLVCFALVAAWLMSGLMSN